MKIPSNRGRSLACSGALLAAFALLMTACGKSSTTDGGPDSGIGDGGYDGGPPVVTFNGAFDGSMTLTVTDQVIINSDDGGVSNVIAYFGGATLNGYSVSLSGATDISGPYDAGTYSPDNPLVTGISFNVSAFPSDGGSYQAWGTGYSAVSQQSSVGTLSTVVTDTGPLDSGINSSSHGSFTGTLIDDVSDGGPVNISGTF